MTEAVSAITVDQAAAHVVTVWRRLKEMGVEPTPELVRVALEHARGQARNASEDSRARAAMRSVPPMSAAPVMRFTPDAPDGVPGNVGL